MCATRTKAAFFCHSSWLLNSTDLYCNLEFVKSQLEKMQGNLPAQDGLVSLVFCLRGTKWQNSEEERIVSRGPRHNRTVQNWPVAKHTPQEGPGNFRAIKPLAVMVAHCQTSSLLFHSSLCFSSYLRVKFLVSQGLKLWKHFWDLLCKNGSTYKSISHSWEHTNTSTQIVQTKIKSICLSGAS